MNFFVKTSSNLYMFWNFGSLISLNMIIQIIIGIFLSMNYFYYSNNLFINSFYIYYNLNIGNIIRLFHSNMTSMIFILIFLHFMRTLIYSNFINFNMWLSGMLMFILLMLISFLGYSMIFSQMSFWASMVITNFISSIPIMGKKLMYLIWGSFEINNLLMNRFLTLHILFPLMLMFMSMIHMIILHEKKSLNPLSINNKFDLINLFPLYIIKDMMMMMILIYMFMIINFINPFYFNNIDNFNFINLNKTPQHIEPEWYFLFFYSILRSIKNKFNGLLLMIFSLIMILLIPKIFKMKILSTNYFMIKKYFLIIFFMNLILISYLGSKLIEYPYDIMNNLMIFFFFFFFLIMLFFLKLINKI